jgi:uncharacterized protein
LRLPLRSNQGVVELLVKATPRAPRNEVTGLVDGPQGNAWLAVKVTAAADRGRANEAILDTLAEFFDVPPSSLRLIAGASGRWKRIALGAHAAEIEIHLRRFAGQT